MLIKKSMHPGFGGGGNSEGDITPECKYKHPFMECRGFWGGFSGWITFMRAFNTISSRQLNYFPA